MKKINFKYGFLYLITFIIVLGGDLVTKLVVNESMQLGQSYQVIKNFFYFTYIHNTGAAWGAFRAFLYVLCNRSEERRVGKEC